MEYDKNSGKSKRTNQTINIVWFVIHQIVMAILLMLASGLVWGYKYLSNQFEDVSISQLLFHMTTDLGELIGQILETYLLRLVVQ